MSDEAQDLPLQTAKFTQYCSIILGLIICHKVRTITNTNDKETEKLFTLIDLAKHFGLHDDLSPKSQEKNYQKVNKKGWSNNVRF